MPDNFTDPKQQDKFKRQLFVYAADNEKDFNQKDEKIIHFQLSFMMAGLPERFTANFVDSVIDSYKKKQKRFREGYMIIELKIDWGTAYDFEEIYHNGQLPEFYNNWKTTIISIDGLDRHHSEQKKAIGMTTFHKPSVAPKQTTEKRTGSSITYSSQGQKMDSTQQGPKDCASVAENWDT
ncbi:hypothetical protein PILCRDRAFT_86739 [Piloderma croceum F 1598]|uniref:Uncharacterized protein n=1 Tax=Piloderma croceum (strain F 1598) TaxID=765440 RepID=A0A0C3C8W1_PILCF|nr:hypothetical protein PILCRDRAFT_86739 [Piloderma croceum F 1598]